MSSYMAVTKHPRTGEWEEAWWMDDYFGHHNYGVKFSDGTIYNPEHVALKVKKR